MQSRRRFLQIAGVVGASFALGFGCSGDGGRKAADKGSKADAADPAARKPTGEDGLYELDAYIAIGTDGRVALAVPEAEMGQGILTGLGMVLADELEVPWDRVTVHMPDADERYGRQGTGGSTSTRGSHDALRQAAAAARTLLIQAAASKWGVPPESCTARDAEVRHPDHGALGYGALVEAAAKLDPPQDPKVKPAGERRLTGTSAPRKDLPDKVDGKTVFGLDVRLPGLLFARVKRNPGFGSVQQKEPDTAEARAVKGVVEVVGIESGVAVVGAHTWAAIQGVDKVQLHRTAPRELDDASVRAACEAVIDQGEEATSRGVMKPQKGLRTLGAEYVVPYLAHATMEPMNCTALVHEDGRVEVWAPTQGPTSARTAAAEAAGVEESAVTIHSTFMGGGFGRRSKPDFVAEAVQVAKALPGKPVQLGWSREDDMQGGWYRPFSLNRLRGAVDDKGLPVLWEHRIATPSILAGMGRTGIDGTSIEGAANLPYAIPNLRVTCAAPDLPVPLWFWRSVGSSQNAFVTECFFDELCALGGRDPVEARLALLGEHPRHARVLQRAVELAGYGAGAPEGHAFGVAVHESFGSICAQVADVSLDGDRPRVHRVFCAIDCGQVVNPDSVAAQMDSCIAYGLSAALYGRISLKEGRVQQRNFTDYKVVRIDEMPQVQTVVVAEGDPWGGVGEPGTPPLAPALCNALRLLRGEPVRSLPLLA